MLFDGPSIRENAVTFLTKIGAVVQWLNRRSGSLMVFLMPQVLFKRLFVHELPFALHATELGCLDCRAR
ncbi:MAG: hypothetical protein Q9181_007957, partial [Wetmoreana brouardii]